jgi:hypothetical protein
MVASSGGGGRSLEIYLDLGGDLKAYSCRSASLSLLEELLRSVTPAALRPTRAEGAESQFEPVVP